MGIFTRQRTVIGWTSEKIVPLPNWQAHQTARPSFAALADALISESGRDSRRIDTAKVVGALTNICKSIACENLPDRVAAIEAILERPGPTRDEIWDYFTHAGAKGVAVSNNIGELLTSEKVRNVINKMIDEGQVAATGDTALDGLPMMSPDSPETVALSDPDGDELDPVRTAFNLISSVGVSVIVYGPGNVFDCFLATSRAAPIFSETTTESGLLGAFPDLPNSYWFGIDGVDGSAIVVPVAPNVDGNRILHEIIYPVLGVGPPWSTAIARGSVVPATFAKIFGRSVIRRVWHLPGLHELAPVGCDPLELSWDHRAQLIADGWTKISGDAFSREFADGQGGRFAVHLAPWEGSHTVFAVIGEPVAGRIPQELTRFTFHSCEVALAYEQIVLIERLRGPGLPSLADIKVAADRVSEGLSVISGASVNPPSRGVADPPAESSPVSEYEHQPIAAVVLTRGANCAMSAHRVRVELRWDTGPAGATLDTSALLLANNGRVRSDSDFVFYNQPRHDKCSVRHERSTGIATVNDCVAMDLTTATSYADTIVVVGSLDGGTFSALQGLCAVVVDSDSGANVISFPITGLSTETALIVGEMYQRNGGWKFRAVGQGYAAGLRGVAEDFGITVD